MIRERIVVLLVSESTSDAPLIEIVNRVKGSVLAKALLERRPGTKLIFMLGHSDDIVSPDEVGAEFIQKPFTSEALVRRIRQTLDAPRFPQRVIQ